LSVVRREISGLPKLLRSAVCLHFYGNMTYPELSAALECSEKAARKRVERGVQRLRLRLASCGLAIGAGRCRCAGWTHAGQRCGVRIESFERIIGIASRRVAGAFASSGRAAGRAWPKREGIAIMGKYVVGVAALLAFALSGVQAIRIHSMARIGRCATRPRQRKNRDRLAALRNSLLKTRARQRR
jgi:hypothetical protein